MSRIMIDLDGCVYDYVSAFADCVAERRGQRRSELSPPESWTFYKQDGWDMTTESFLEHMRYAIRNQSLFARGDAYPDAMDALHELRHLGHQLFIISARKYGTDTEVDAAYQTMDWLGWAKAPRFEGIFLTSGEPKSKICTELHLNIAIEDSLDNFRDIAKNSETLAYLMDRTWNDSTEQWVKPFRVKSWGEFVGKFDAT